MIRVLIFDWGDTLMRDFPEMSGPMAHWPHIQVLPGVSEALERIDSSLLCCVASNAGASDAPLMLLALERGGIRDHFLHFFTAKELGASKPDAHFFREVANRLGVTPAECAMVGNDYEKDIVGAKKAGFHTVWLTTSLVVSAEPASASRVSANQAATGRNSADIVITHMSALPTAIQQLQQSDWL